MFHMFLCLYARQDGQLCVVGMCPKRQFPKVTLLLLCHATWLPPIRCDQQGKKTVFLTVIEPGM